VDTVQVGPFSVVDVPAREIVAWAGERPGSRRATFAVHVGGLNAVHDQPFVDAMNAADLVYADGASVVWLARAAGARRIERAATTDIGIPMIAAVASSLGRPARIAIVGGRDGIAELAGLRLERFVDARCVLARSGYFDDDSQVLDELQLASPDVIIVGMGMPREAIWVAKNFDSLPSSLIFTCGGWLGFLAGSERRAPALMQSLHLEWLYRLCQSPRRLVGRYAQGLLTVGSLLPDQISRRGTTTTDASTPAKASQS
jgi:N-acetylglucosaminyldiphosphoundecaprenol N-acetyl-beta-D-mannosaminyltransferase